MITDDFGVLRPCEPTRCKGDAALMMRNGKERINDNKKKQFRLCKNNNNKKIKFSKKAKADK